MNTASQLFAELRALLSDAPSHWLREQVYAQINSFAKHAEALEFECFENEFLPTVLTLVERWPDMMRLCCVHEHGPGELMLARILSITCRNSNSISPPAHTLSELFEMLPASALERMSGFMLNCAYLDDALLEVLLEALPPPLSHVHLELMSSTQEMVAWLVSNQYSPHITHFSIKRAHETTYYAPQPARYIGALLKHLEHFPNLRHLSLDDINAPHGDERNWLAELQSHPISQQLETLEVLVHSSRFDGTVMTLPGAWPNLKNLRINGLTHRQAEALMHAPELAHVERWNLAKPHVTNTLDWFDVYSRFWTARARGRPPGEALHAHDVDLSMFDVGDLMEVFLTPERSLRPSSRLRTLTFDRIPHLLFEALFEQGHKAYPNLEKISCNQVTLFAVEDYYTLQESPLWHQLTRFTWHVPHLRPTYDLYTTTRDERSKKQDQAYEDWGFIILDDTLDITLRQHAWDVLIRQLDTMKHYRKVARVLQLDNFYHDRKKTLIARLQNLRPGSQTLAYS